MRDFLESIDKVISNTFSLVKTPFFDSLKKALDNKNITPTNLDTKLTWIDKYTHALENKLVKNLITLTDRQIEIYSKQLGIEIPRLEFLRDLKNNVYNLTSTLAPKIKNEIIDYLSYQMVRPSSKIDLIKLSENIEKSINQTQNLIKETNSVLNRDFINKQHLKLEKNFKVKYYYEGPNDSKMSDFCKLYYGKSFTRAEWEAIKSDIFTHGGHFGCRHYFRVDTSKLVRRKVA